MGAGVANPPASALRSLSEFGLPDARGAKWVRMEGYGSFSSDDELPSTTDGRGLRGNAWLVREEKGRLTLIVNQTRVVHVRQAKEEPSGEEAPEGEPMAQ